VIHDTILLEDMLAVPGIHTKTLDALEAAFRQMHLDAGFTCSLEDDRHLADGAVMQSRLKRVRLSHVHSPTV